MTRIALSRDDLKNKQETPAISGGGSTPDSYADQILKYIPAEVVAFYVPALTTVALLRAPKTAIDSSGATVVNGSVPTLSYWAGALIIFFAGLICTYIYISKKSEATLLSEGIADPKGRAVLKGIISSVAFFIWAIYLGGLFESIGNYVVYGTLGILGFTLVAPAIYDDLANRIFTPFQALKIDGVRPDPNDPKIIKTVTVSSTIGIPIKVTLLELYEKRMVWGDKKVDETRPTDADVESHGKKDVETQLQLSERKKFIVLAKSREGYIAVSQPISK
jgi:hypothetical protein